MLFGLFILIPTDEDCCQEMVFKSRPDECRPCCLQLQQLFYLGTGEKTALEIYNLSL